MLCYRKFVNFQGYHLDQCLPFTVSANIAEIVWVPGSPLNPCGHLLIKLGVLSNNRLPQDYYFHVPGISMNHKTLFGLRDEPYYFPAHEFRRYLVANDKNERLVIRHRHFLTQQDKVRVGNNISKLMENKWAFKLIFNCQTFVEKVMSGLEGVADDPTVFDCPGRDMDISPFNAALRSSAWARFVNYVMGF